jgi:farnesyl diphosphate synthase
MSQQVIEQYLKRHEQYLTQIINDVDVPASIIKEAMHYSLFPGGKRIRPILVYLIGELIDVDIQVLDAIAAAIELTHCYSLIHDDLPSMDNDDFRRGKPSCHKAYGEATAILVGDGLQALAIEILLNHLKPHLSSDRIIALTLELVRASGVSGMVSGQSLDLSELSKKSLTEDTLENIHILKTGRLISACIEMVLKAAPDIAPEKADSLKKFGQHIGLVFQMQDDFLDCFAPSNHLGKNRSSDIANQKTTYATFHSRSDLIQEINSHYAIALDLISLFNNKTSELRELTEALHARTNEIAFNHA